MDIDKSSAFLDAIARRDKTLRRYMDFAKFMSLLQNEALFFPVADSLPDRAEGMPYTKQVQMKMNVLADIIDQNSPGQPKVKRIFTDHERKKQELVKSFVVISSWYSGPYESYAMWKMYAQEGICICSTPENLEQSLSRQDVVIRKVDYEKLPNIQPEYLAAFFKKLPAYGYESEVRAVIDLFEHIWAHSERMSEPIYQELLRDKGMLVPVDLKKLVTSVTISPLAKPWFKNLVTDVVSKYGLNVSVEFSELYKEVSF